jgi:hypothetical protein
MPATVQMTVNAMSKTRGQPTTGPNWIGLLDFCQTL